MKVFPDKVIKLGNNYGVPDVISDAVKVRGKLKGSVALIVNEPVG